MSKSILKQVKGNVLTFCVIVLSLKKKSNQLTLDFIDVEPLLFSFRVKFFPADPFRLTGNSKIMIYQQLKRDLIHGRLYCSAGEAAALGSLIVQGKQYFRIDIQRAFKVKAVLRSMYKMKYEMISFCCHVLCNVTKNGECEKHFVYLAKNSEVTRCRARFFVYALYMSHLFVASFQSLGFSSFLINISNFHE